MSIFPEDLFSDGKRGGCFETPLTGLTLLHGPLESALRGWRPFPDNAQSLSQGLFGCLKVSDGHKTTRLEEDMAYISQVSPDFSMVDPLVRAELNMGPRSKPNCSRKRLGTLAGVGGGQRRHFRVSCLGQLARAQDSYLPVYLGSFPPNPTSSQHVVAS